MKNQNIMSNSETLKYVFEHSSGNEDMSFNEYIVKKYEQLLRDYFTLKIKVEELTKLDLSKENEMLPQSLYHISKLN